MGLEYDQNGCKLLYNTERKSLRLPEYGRNVQKMIEYLRSIPDREKRNQQARAVVKVREILNPQVHLPFTVSYVLRILHTLRHLNFKVIHLNIEDTGLRVVPTILWSHGNKQWDQDKNTGKLFWSPIRI